MKKPTKFLICLLLLNSGLLMAQSSGDKLEFGLGLSPSISWVNSNTKMVMSNGAGYNFGFGARINYKINDKYAFGFEVNMQNINSLIHVPGIDLKPENDPLIPLTDVALNYKLKYLELPVMLKMHTQEKNDLRFYGEFGFVLGFLLNQKADVVSQFYNRDNVNSDALEEGDKFELRNTKDASIRYAINVNTLRAGLLFGAGIEKHILADSRFDLGLRYNLGLSDFQDESKWQATNSYIALNLAFFF